MPCFHVFVGADKCECKFPRDCAKDAPVAFCVKMLKTQTQRSMSVCVTASLKCLKMEAEVSKEGPCDAA